VNDSYGNAAGDFLLIGVAERLSLLIRPGDTVARVAGDESVILCDDMDSIGHAESLAGRIAQAFCAPFIPGSNEVSITASVGIAYSGRGAAVTNDLVTRADHAMYQAERKAGAAHQVIDLRKAQELQDRDNLERDLRSALRTGAGLDLAYQPIVRISDGLVVGAEALLRWTHAELGSVPALTAVSIAEQAHSFHSWERGYCAAPARTDTHGSQNIRPDRWSFPSTSQPASSWAWTFRHGRRRARRDPNGSLRTSPGSHRRHLRVALDDFGTGYSSLSYLRRFPVDILKIDQSFVADIEHDEVDRALIGAVANLAHLLGLTVTAEGIETLERHDLVVGLGCEQGQGYFYARPMSADDLASQLAALPGILLRLPHGVAIVGAKSDA
jgi:diguanylate cyclase (GGDEF)-like protein